MKDFSSTFIFMTGEGKVLKYSASAGSGKTHALTGFYLSRVLYDPTAYRHILAVTFTNSAAAEMKSRILTELYKLASGEKSEFVDYLRDTFPEMISSGVGSEEKLRRNASLALNYILHDYSRFTVGTIDSFFQRVIRAFVREIDIPSGYELELEHDMLLSDAVEELLKEVSTDRKLREWITSYVESRLDDNRSWDVRRDIMEVAQQIFREDFRQLTKDQRDSLSDYDNLKKYSEKVFSIRSAFEKELMEMAAHGIEIYERCGLGISDFSQVAKGVGGWLKKYSEGEVSKPNSFWNKAVSENIYTVAKPTPYVKEAMDSALSQGLGGMVKGISDLFEKRYPVYAAACAQVRTIHIMGILGSVSARVRVLAHDENIFLLSDSGELINKLIHDDDTPFIYEKIGAQYDNYIIDEFQDTSRIQWRNFQPLIAETLARGNDNLVVGDVKQSIYRWRNSDWRIIHSEVDKAFSRDAVRSDYLDTNYRSRANIIKFNNRIFSPENIPALCDTKLNFEPLRIADVYNEAVQKENPFRPGGFVNVRLFSDEKEDKWKDNVLAELPLLIEKLQDHGYHARDIMFLCRKNDEGKSIINRLLEYSASCPQERSMRYNFEVTSGESLYLERNPAVSLLVSCLRYMVDPSGRINQSLMVRCYGLAMGKEDDSVYAGDMTGIISEKVFPEGWKEKLDSFRNSSLFAATEKMIQLFGLGDNSANVAYLNSFQDLILWYSSRYTSDISSFVGWWEKEGSKRTVAQSDRQEAMRVMTIHKAKGLQSKVVIMPFADWKFDPPVFSKPLLWIKDVPESFSPMPVVLPEFSSKLDDSLFSNQAGLERVSLHLDAVNMLYVACTRAVDALFIMAPDARKKKNNDSNSSIAWLLRDGLKNGVEGSEWQDDGVNKQISLGELPSVEHDEEPPILRLEQYKVSDREGIMRLRTGGAMPLDEKRLEEESGRIYGIVMHELLSRIRTIDDIENAVQILADTGMVMREEVTGLQEKTKQMLSGSKVKEWFDGSMRVLTEATVLLPSGNARRPDRVMMDGDKVIVVDYKFGEPEKKHKHQAEEYRRVLKEMGYSNVESYLWYIEKEIIELLNY
jgi:ATP-dependent helicase/nuclease subunit A